MGILVSTIGQSVLDTDYTSAKIMADPYNYRLSKRLITCTAIDYMKNYNICQMNMCSEFELAEALDLETDDVAYLNPNKDLSLLRMYEEPDEEDTYTIDRQLHFIDTEFSLEGFMFDFNNLIVNETILLQDLNDVMGCKSKVAAVNYLKTNPFLKSFEMIYTMLLAKGSLIPSLFYFNTEYIDRSLEDIEDIKFAKEFIDAGKAPFVYPYFSVESFKDRNAILSTCIPPMLTDKTIMDPRTKDALLFPTDFNMGSDIYNVGLGYTLAFGCEIMYKLSKMKTMAPELYAYLTSALSEGYAKTPTTDLLFSVDSYGDLIVNSDLEDCFDDDPKVRFNNFKHYFKNNIKSLALCVGLGMDHYRQSYTVPKLFGRLIQSCHSYAFQVARIKHVALMYNEAKAKGVLEDIDNDICNSGLAGGMAGSGSLGLSTGDMDDDFRSLMDLHSDKYSKDSSVPKPDDSVVESSKRKVSDAFLTPLQQLQSDMEKSKYDFEVNTVRHSPSMSSRYENTVKTIKPLCMALTKQIREIRTYNSGGKNSGLATGKLDRKNLWNYKNSPKIFYNNTYKVKEMDLAFGCILDESGSMYGDNIKNGRVVMMLLHEVLSSLSINHSIIGHTSRGKHQCVINKYFKFKEEKGYTVEKPYSLADIYAKQGNCDSAALFYMQSLMKSVKNKDKIIIIFSDGQPTECSDTELINQVTALEKSGIHVIGVGIDFDSIKNYYPDNANGRNLKEMLDIVVNILKRYVLEKKDA